MVLSYARIRLPIDEALLRFSQWIGLPALGPPSKVKASEAVDAACTNGAWRSVVAVFVYQSGEWTVFDDETGHLASFSADQWLSFAGQDELVFAGYNDTVPYGQLIVVRGGRVIREFLDDEDDPRQNANRGQLDFEKASPLKDWISVTAFVDGDEVASFPDAGLLWMFGELPESGQ